MCHGLRVLDISKQQSWVIWNIALCRHPESTDQYRSVSMWEKKIVKPDPAHLMALLTSVCALICDHMYTKIHKAIALSWCTVVPESLKLHPPSSESLQLLQKHQNLGHLGPSKLRREI